jgi:excisionase family DNA binding protein
MKRFYSVKEASELLGVSTNTVYKYLVEGRIESRRIGRGRIKILASSLKPYINKKPETKVQKETAPIKQEVSQNVVQQKVEEVKPNVVSTPTLDGGISGVAKEVKQEDSDDVGKISLGKEDRIFFRIFKLLMFMGLGIIFITTNNRDFSTAVLINAEITQLLEFVFPIALLLGGIAGIIATLFGKVTRQVEIVGHIVFALILSYCSYSSYYASQGGLFIFTAALTIIMFDHLIRGLTSLSTDDNFSSRFSKYLVVLFTIAGLFILDRSSLITIGFVKDLVISKSNIVGFVWFGMFIPVLVYFASPLGMKSKYSWIAFIPSGVILILFATMFTTRLEWDTSYASYLTGIFAFFLVAWKFMNLKVSIEKIGIVLAGFVWTSLAILFALIAVHMSQNQFREEVSSDIRLGANKIVGEINNVFERYHSVVIPVAGSDEVVEIIVEDDREAAIEKAKLIYDQLDGVNMVAIFNKEGNAIGSYPRNDLVQGTNFSSRDYFMKTKESYSHYTSAVFNTILDYKSVAHTEPIFENNEFIGMIVSGFNLTEMGQNFQRILGSGYQLMMEDGQGGALFGDSSAVVEEVSSLEDPQIKVITSISNPEWKLTIGVSEQSVFERTSNTLLFISVVLLINSLVSVSAVLYYASRKDASEIIRGMKFPLTGIQGGMPASKPQLA